MSLTVFIAWFHLQVKLLINLLKISRRVTHEILVFITITYIFHGYERSVLKMSIDTGLGF